MTRPPRFMRRGWQRFDRTMHICDTNVVSYYVDANARTRYPGVCQVVDDIRAKDGVLTVAAVSVYELRRGLISQPRALQIQLEKFIHSCDVLGLDVNNFAGWDAAARLWGYGRIRKPAITLQEGDLLIAATAAVHRRQLVTADAKLADNLLQIAPLLDVRLLSAA